MKIARFISALIVALFIPSALVFAQPVTTVSQLIARLTELLVVIIPFIIGLTVLVILWGIFLYITKAGEEEKRSEAKLYIIWGIFSLFVMVSLWGFVNVLDTTFNLDKTVPKNLPQAPTL